MLTGGVGKWVIVPGEGYDEACAEYQELIKRQGFDWLWNGGLPGDCNRRAIDANGDVKLEFGDRVPSTFPGLINRLVNRKEWRTHDEICDRPMRTPLTGTMLPQGNVRTSRWTRTLLVAWNSTQVIAPWTTSCRALLILETTFQGSLTPIGVKGGKTSAHMSSAHMSGVTQHLNFVGDTMAIPGHSGESWKRRTTCGGGGRRQGWLVGKTPSSKMWVLWLFCPQICKVLRKNLLHGDFVFLGARFPHFPHFPHFLPPPFLPSSRPQQYYYSTIPLPFIEIIEE